MTEKEVAARFEAAIQVCNFGDFVNVKVGEFFAATFDGKDAERKAVVWRRELTESMTDAFMRELAKGAQQG